MKGYFSRLIQQTGLKPGQQGENKVYSHQGSDNTLIQPAVTPDQPESLEVEEIIEVAPLSDSVAPSHHETAKSVDEENLKSSAVPDQPESLQIEEFIEVTPPSDAIAPNHHETAKSVDEENLKPAVTPDQPESLEIERFIEDAKPESAATPTHHEIAKRAKQAPSPTPDVLEQRKAVSSPQIIIPPKPAQAKERQQTREREAEPANIDRTKTDVSPLNKKLETAGESQPQTRSHEKARSAAKPPITEPSMHSETAGSPSPASLEQHVYMAQLPDTYQQVIKEWLTSPAEESKDPLSGREKLKASLKSKPNSRVILKPKPAAADFLPDKQIGNGQFKTRDLHLSVGNINLTIEEPEPVKRQSPEISNKPARRQQSGSSRLSRHYVRVR